MTGHYDETVLQDYLDDPNAIDDRGALEQHVAECTKCRVLLEELRAFDATLANDATWEPPANAPAKEPPESTRALAELLAHEDAEAKRMLDPLLGSPATFRRANVATTPSMQTAGVVRRLCSDSRALRERQPMHALVVADAAIAIADQLTSARYSHPLLDELRGNAWFERANVLRYLGRYPEAIDALDIAARAYARSPVAAFSGATVDYLRSVIFVELARFDDARRLARKSARIFRQFGERERFIHAKIVEASILFHEERLRDARELFASLLPDAKEIGQPETMARLFANVANCDVRLGDFDSAAGYFARALSLYEAVGNETGKIRTRWNIGSMRIAAGDVDEGLVRLRHARDEFDRIGARTDAALVALEIVEALLSKDTHAALKEATELSSGLADSFAAIGMTGNALTALSFLRQAFESGKVTTSLVRYIRHYIETRPDQEGNPFIPPTGM